MDKIDTEGLSFTLVEYRMLAKLNELVEEWNSHKEWHRRFFDKYNKEK